jgi:hypothetical protein
VLAKCGVQVSDLFGVEGTALLDRLDLAAPYAARIGSLRRIMDLLDFEIDHVAGMVRGRLAADPGYAAVQTIPGIGPTLAAVLVAEIGDIGRFLSWPVDSRPVSRAGSTSCGVARPATIDGYVWRVGPKGESERSVTGSPVVAPLLKSGRIYLALRIVPAHGVALDRLGFATLLGLGL